MLNSKQFKFLGQHYLQMSGTAMDSKIAPSYANLFMGMSEKQMLSSYKHKPLVYFRYMDYIFMIWTGGEDSLNDFLTHCNSQTKNIQFEQTISNASIPFLVVSVTLEDGKLTTDLYCKFPDKHQYLYHRSCHPKHTRTSLPYCLAPRLRRICSSENLFRQRTNEELHHLIQRGYKKRCIHDAIKKASLVTREEALADKTKPKSLQRVPFVVTYNPMLPNIPKILHEAHPVLHASERCTEIFKNVPLVSYRRARNFSDILCSKRLASRKHHNPTPSQTCQNNNDNPPPNTNQFPECGLKLKNSMGQKIISLQNIYGSKTILPPLDSGLASLTPDVTHTSKGYSPPQSPVAVMEKPSTSSSL